MKKFAAVFVMGLFVVMNVLGAEEVTNTATLHWTGVEVAFGVNSTTNASKLEVYLMDEGRVSRTEMSAAFESDDYNTRLVALAKGVVTETSGMLGSCGTNGAWECEGVLPEEYCGTNVVKFYTLILNEKYTRDGGYYLMTDVLERGLTNGQEVCEMDFGVVTNGWTVYKKVSGSSEKAAEEALPIVDPAEEGAQYTWSGVKVPLNGGALTNSVNWDIKLIDAGKVPREEMIAALESKKYMTIYEAVTNGLVASTTAKIWETTKIVSWVRSGRLPKEYQQGSQATYQFYTVIFDKSLRPASGNYLITEVKDRSIPGVGAVVIAFGDLSGLKWNAYTIGEESSGADDGGDSGDDDGGTSVGEVKLYWTGADVNVSGDIATNAAAWDIRLMDAGKVPRWKMRTAFINADVQAIGEALTNGLVVATTGIVSKTSSTVSWAYEGVMGGEYRAGKTLKFYTLILDRAFDGKTGEYLMTEEVEGSIETNAVAAGECGMDFGILSDEKWSCFEIAEEDEDVPQTNEVKLVWSGVEVAFGVNSTTNASKWEVYLMDEGRVSRTEMSAAFESDDYNTRLVALAKGVVTETSGMLGSCGTNGAWECEGVLPEEYCGTNVVRFYTLILNEKYTRDGGYYLMTDVLERGITNGQEVCEMDFGAVTNGWTVYKKVSGSSEKAAEEALPIVDPAEEGAQYTWSGVKVPLNGGALTNSVNWDIKLIDAGKVPREEMIAALESKEYMTIYEAVTNGLVASTTAKIWEPTKMLQWSRQGRLPKEYRQGSQAELKFYTVIFDKSLRPASGNYLITEVVERTIPGVGAVVIAFGDLSGLKWNAYTIEKGSSGDDDGDGEDEDDEDDDSVGEVELNWTGRGIIAQTGLTEPKEWKVFLMDEGKVAMTNLIAAFKGKDYKTVRAEIRNGMMLAPANVTGTSEDGVSFTTTGGTSTNGVDLVKAAWSSTGLYLPEEYTTEEYQTNNAIRCYTLILNHGLDEKESGRYILSRVVLGNVVRVKSVGKEEETYTCKLDFGSYSASNRETRKWCAYSFEQSAKPDAESDDEDLAVENVTLSWTGEKLPRGKGEKEPSEWEFILMDARKVSISKLRAAFASTNYVDYGKVTWLIDKGCVASKVGGTSAGTNSVKWSFSGTLADEYLTGENRTENELRFYTLILDHSLTEGEAGRYFVTRVLTGSISASDEIAAEDGEGSETTYSCVMAFGSQAFMECAWRKYVALVVTGEEYEEEGDDDESAADIEFSSAQVYDGYLTTDGSDVVGSIQVKVSKEKWNKREETRESTIKATIQLTGEKKVSIKGTLDLSEGGVSLEAKDGRELDLEFTMDEIEGMFDGYEIVGARNIFTTKDKTDKTAAKFATNLWKVPVGIAWLNEEGGGYNNLVMTVGSKGKVKIVGTVDGQKVSTSAQLLVDGEGNTFVSVNYSKRSVGLAFVVRKETSEDEGKVAVIGLEDDGLVYGEAKSFEEKATFSLEDGDELLEAAGDEDATYSEYLPDGIEITLKGTKWSLPKAGKVMMRNDEIVEEKLGENPAGLKLKYKEKAGTFSGSFKAYIDKKGKPKGVTVSVSGVMIDGKGYGMATIKKAGSVAVTIE